MCSIKSHEFDRHGRGFEHHINHEHNMWNYVYFLLYLDQKDPNDYTSHEFYVAQKFEENEELAFIPVNRALVLDHRSNEEDKVSPWHIMALPNLCVSTPSLTHSLTHTHTHTLSLSLTHSLSHSLSHSLTHSPRSID